MRFYFGQVGWGWKMYGIGYNVVWFLGFSRAIKGNILVGGMADNGGETK